MAGTIDMNYNQKFHGVPVFKDDAGNVVAVDAIRWTMGDNMGGVLTQTGEEIDFVADATQAMDTPARTSILRAEVDEAGVANAFFDTWDVVVHGPASQAATRMEVNFAVSDQV